MTALETQFLQLRNEMRAEFSATRKEMREGDEEAKRHARILHEDLVSRISTIQEGLNLRRRPRKR